ncbi:MAK10-like protein [Tanacetum coccineum]
MEPTPSPSLERGSITTWEDLITRFLAQFFPPGRTAKLRNDILMFQQHLGESLSEAWTPGGKLRDQNAKESWALLEDLALYDNESWNDLRDFAKPVKAIALPQDVPSTSDRRLIKLKNQVQRLMEAHLALTQPTQVNKITTSCEICNGPYDTQYCMKDPEQAFVEYASSRTDETGGLINAVTIHSEKQSDSYDKKAKENEEEEKDTWKISMSTLPYRLIHQLHSSLEMFSNLNHSSNRSDWFLNHPTPSEGELEEEGSTTLEGVGAEYFDIFPTRSKLAYHKENSNRGVSNFIRRIKVMHVFIGNFTYITDFMIVEGISSIIDPRLSQVVLGKPSVDISNMTHDLPEGIVRFTNGTDEVTNKMPHMIELYNSLSNLEKEHTKLVYLRNEEDTRRGVEYVMSKILGFYKECLELGQEYVTGMDDEGENT